MADPNDPLDYGDHAGRGWGDFQPTPMDRVSLLIPDFNVELQLAAVRGLLRRARVADGALVAELEALAQHARDLPEPASERAIDEWGDKFYTSIYQDAAHSMAAVGMLAPTIEGVLTQAYEGLHLRYFVGSDPATGHERWTIPGQEAERWDCHFVGLPLADPPWQSNIAAGIVQLSDALGLLSRFPADTAPILQVLFRYRNKMFHNGLEWPVRERVRFARAMADEVWPENWFAKTTAGGRPWIYCLSQSYVDRCLQVFEAMLTVIGHFCKEQDERRAAQSA